jgi:hypothetical protein
MTAYVCSFHRIGCALLIYCVLSSEYKCDVSMLSTKYIYIEIIHLEFGYQLF